MRKFFYIACMLCAVGIANAQELKCTVTINSDAIEGSNKQVYETLKTTIEEYMNSNRWTNMTYAEQERIECSMLLIVKSVADDVRLRDDLAEPKTGLRHDVHYSTPEFCGQELQFHLSGV